MIWLVRIMLLVSAIVLGCDGAGSGTSGDAGARTRLSFSWARTTNKIWINSIAADRAGNSYITGTYQGTVTFGSTSLTATGSWGIFVVKLDSSGRYLWASSADSSSSIYSGAISVDASGSCAIMGSFSGSAKFDGTTIKATAHWAIFVARLDSSGKFISAAALPVKVSKSLSTTLAVDEAGNGYLAGDFMGTVTLGGKALTSKSQKSLYMAKVRPDGALAWSLRAGGEQENSCNALASYSGGNVYITGEFAGKLTLGAATLSSRGGRDIYVARLDRDGKFTWAASAGGKLNDWATAIAVDSAGRGHVTGEFRDTASFGSTSLTSRGGRDVYVARLDQSGKFTWAASAGGQGSERASSIAVDGDGVTHLAGLFNDAASFGATSLTSRGGQDIFVARLDRGGAFGPAIAAGGKLNDWASAVASGGSGDSFIVGYFSREATFGDTRLTAASPGGPFIARVATAARSR